MAGDSSNARVYDHFDAYAAVFGSTAPTDLATAFAAAWLPVGLGGEGGITESRDQSADNKYDWNGNIVRTIRGPVAVTFKFTMLEDNYVTFALLNPGSTATATTGVTTRVVKKPVGDKRAWAFELRDGTAVSSRIICASAELTEVGDLQRVNSELASRDVTVTVYPQSDGTLYREITNAPGAVPVP